jgi:hypothetical protein
MLEGDEETNNINMLGQKLPLIQTKKLLRSKDDPSHHHCKYISLYQSRI